MEEWMDNNEIERKNIDFFNLTGFRGYVR